MIQSWENLKDKQTDSDFIGRCPNNAERPTWKMEIIEKLKMDIFMKVLRWN